MSADRKGDPLCHRVTSSLPLCSPLQADWDSSVSYQSACVARQLDEPMFPNDKATAQLSQAWDNMDQTWQKGDMKEQSVHIPSPL